MATHSSILATHSSILAWRILWTEEPDGLQSVVLQTVRHNWVTKSISDRVYQVKGTLSLQLGHRKGVNGRKEISDQGRVVLAAGMKSLRSILYSMRPCSRSNMHSVKDLAQLSLLPSSP